MTDYEKSLEAQNEQLRQTIEILAHANDDLATQLLAKTHQYKNFREGFIKIIGRSNTDFTRSRPRHSSEESLEGSTYIKFMFSCGRDGFDGIPSEMNEILHDKYRSDLEGTIEGIKRAEYSTQSKSWHYVTCPDPDFALKYKKKTS